MQPIGHADAIPLQLDATRHDQDQEGLLQGHFARFSHVVLCTVHETYKETWLKREKSM